MNTTNNSNADTVLGQLGGAARLYATMGGHTFLSTNKGNTLSFCFGAKNAGKYNYCEIALDPAGACDVTIAALRQRRTDARPAAKRSGVPVDQIRGVIESVTGLRLR